MAFTQVCGERSTTKKRNETFSRKKRSFRYNGSQNEGRNSKGPIA